MSRFFHPSAFLLPLSQFKLSKEVHDVPIGLIPGAHQFLIGISIPPHSPIGHRENKLYSTIIQGMRNILHNIFHVHLTHILMGFSTSAVRNTSIARIHTFFHLFVLPFIPSYIPAFLQFVRTVARSYAARFGHIHTPQVHIHMSPWSYTLRNPHPRPWRRTNEPPEFVHTPQRPPYERMNP